MNKTILKVKDFFEESQLAILQNHSLELIKKGKNSFAVNYSWDKAIVKDSFPTLIHTLPMEEDLYNDLKLSINNKLLEYNLQIIDTIMIYYWTRYSYIPWHNDESYDAGLTVYLNKVWNRDWGGYFLYEADNSEMKAILPENNLGVIQVGGVMHSTTPVNYYGTLRITLQAFLRKIKQ